MGKVEGSRSYLEACYGLVHEVSVVGEAGPLVRVRPHPLVVERGRQVRHGPQRGQLQHGVHALQLGHQELGGDLVDLGLEVGLAGPRRRLPHAVQDGAPRLQLVLADAAAVLQEAEEGARLLLRPGLQQQLQLVQHQGQVAGGARPEGLGARQLLLLVGVVGGDEHGVEPLRDQGPVGGRALERLVA